MGQLEHVDIQAEAVYIRILVVDAAENDHGRFVLLLFLCNDGEFRIHLTFLFKKNVNSMYALICWQIFAVVVVVGVAFLHSHCSGD